MLVSATRVARRGRRLAHGFPSDMQHEHACQPANCACVRRRSSRMATPLDEVGFWADPRDPTDQRAQPAAAVDHGWDGRARMAAVEYLRCGHLESFELGPSFCRFGCRGGRPDSSMGCATLTDGRFVWPEGCAKCCGLGASTRSALQP